MVATNREVINNEEEKSPIIEKVVRISRISKVVKGGRHLRFNAVVVVGDGEGNVGIGMGKAAAVPDAVKKASFSARKEIGPVILDDSTIPHEIIATFGSSTVMLKPAKIGTGIIAGGAVRAVVELAGIRDVVTKARGSTNPVNTVKSTLRALQSLRNVNSTLEERRSFNNKDIK